jgi:hypothetical protein
MKLSDKQTLLSYFKERATRNLVTVCDITGISFEIVAPVIPNIKGHCFSGLSPLANKDTAEQLALARYSEAHYDLSSSVLAGTLLSLFHHYKLREDHLSAIEANMVLSQLPLFQLSQTCNFVANLSDHELRRIPRLSLESGEPSTLKHWYLDSLRVLDVTDFELPQTKQPKIEKKTFQDNSVSVEDRKAARELLKTLKANSILPLKLQTIIQMSIQKNNLAMISAELRKNIIAGLEKLGTVECISLASIFSHIGKNLTNSDAIVSKLLDEPVSQFKDITNAPSIKLTLAEIIAQKKEQAARKPMDEALSLIAEIDQEDQDNEEEAIDPEFLVDHESNEAIMAEAGISELNLSSDDFVSNEDQEAIDSSNLDLDSLIDSEEEQS